MKLAFLHPAEQPHHSTIQATIQRVRLRQSTAIIGPKHDGRHRRRDTFGLSTPMYAFLLTTASGASLPLGAGMGILLSPVKEATNAGMMAFGAGALLFAVTVELYGHAFHLYNEGARTIHEMCTMLVLAVIGAHAYMWVSAALDEHFSVHESPHAEVKDEESSTDSSLSPETSPPDSPKLPLEKPDSSLSSSQSSPEVPSRVLAKNNDSGRPRDLPAPKAASLAMTHSKTCVPRLADTSLRDAILPKRTSYSGSDLTMGRIATLPEGRRRSAALDRLNSTAPNLRSLTEKPTVKPLTLTAMLKQCEDHRVRKKARHLWKRLRETVEVMRKQDGSPAVGSHRSGTAQSHHNAAEFMRFARFAQAWKDTAAKPASSDAEGHEETANEETVRKSRLVAMKLFVGLLVDGVPEGILMGFLAAEGHLTPVLVISLFIANFPEAFSSASLLLHGRMSVPLIVGMWGGLCLLIGLLGGLSCYTLLALYPNYGTGTELPLSVSLGISGVEGFAGGAMIACIAAVMLPEAFEDSKGGLIGMSSGFLCTVGFLCAAAIKLFST